MVFPLEDDTNNLILNALAGVRQHPGSQPGPLPRPFQLAGLTDASRAAPEPRAVPPSGSLLHPPPEAPPPPVQPPERSAALPGAGRRTDAGPVLNDEDWVNRLIQFESGGRANAVNPQGNRFGLGQFSRDLLERYGVRNWQDPTEQRRAIRLHAEYLRDRFRQRFGTLPTALQLYNLWQQGEGGGMALIANPEAPAIQAISRFYRNPATARAAIVNNLPPNHWARRNPERLTAGEFTNLFAHRFPRAPGADREIQPPPNTGEVERLRTITDANIDNVIPGARLAQVQPPNANPPPNITPPNELPPTNIVPVSRRPSNITPIPEGALDRPPTRTPPAAGEPPPNQPLPTTAPPNNQPPDLRRYDQPPDPRIAEAIDRLNDPFIPLNARGAIREELTKLREQRWVDVTGGRVLIDPSSGRALQFQSNIVTSPTHVGDIQVQRYFVMQPDGTLREIPRLPGQDTPPTTNPPPNTAPGTDNVPPLRSPPFPQSGDVDALRDWQRESSALDKLSQSRTEHVVSAIAAGTAAIETERRLRTLAAAEARNVIGGPISGYTLQLRQLITQLTGIDFNTTAPAEIINKLSSHLAGELSRVQFGSRVAQSEFQTLLASGVPNLMQSSAGRRVLIDILLQDAQRQIELRNLALRYGHNTADYFNREEEYNRRHPIIIRFGNREIDTSQVRPGDLTRFFSEGGNPTGPRVRRYNPATRRLED